MTYLLVLAASAVVTYFAYRTVKQARASRAPSRCEIRGCREPASVSTRNGDRCAGHATAELLARMGR